MSKKKNKGEIRGLLAGDFYSSDGTAMLRISKKDDGVFLEFVDFEADIYYEWKVDKRDSQFNWGSVEKAQQEGE